MENIVRIKDSDGLVRDISSGAIINTNVNEYQKYLKRKATAEELRNKINDNSKEIIEIKTEITEIKQLLLTLINKES